MANFFYTAGAQRLGIGVDDLAYRPKSGNPDNNPYSYRYVVRRDFSPTQPGFAKLNQSLVPVSLVGNGLQLSGRIALQRLAQLVKGGD